MAQRLIFSAISKRFGKQTGLHPLSLNLEDGEILGFLGPNGAGKTTAIHLALGFLHPTSGSGTLLGKPFGDAQARSRLGFVPDVPVFFSESATRSVELAARLNGVSDRHLARSIRDLLSAVGLQQDEARPRKDARQFSRGMQQRLALAQALINDPELLILDEPAAALDPAGVQQVRELLRNARHAGKSIFFSSHQLTEVEQICDRIAFLNQGRLVHCGSLKEFQSASDRVEIELRGISEAEVIRIYPAAAPNAGALRITIPAHEQRRIIEKVWAAGGEIVSLAPVRRRLEDLFLGVEHHAMKVWEIARRLLYQNRWIYLVLMLWPFGMAAILLVPAATPDVDDVLSILHQECFYGLGLVAFTGSALLGNEQRSRRIANVLARAVSRRQYFFALVSAAWLPLALYVVSFLVSGGALLSAIHRPPTLLFALALALLVLGMWTAAAALFFATWLPAMLASTASLALLALLGLVGYHWPDFVPARLLFSLGQGDLEGAARALHHPGSFLLIIVGAALLFAAGTTIFERRDLGLKSD